MLPSLRHDKSTCLSPNRSVRHFGRQHDGLGAMRNVTAHISFDFIEQNGKCISAG